MTWYEIGHSIFLIWLCILWYRMTMKAWRTPKNHG